jgi:hypothetical protein
MSISKTLNEAIAAKVAERAESIVYFMRLGYSRADAENMTGPSTFGPASLAQVDALVAKEVAA